MSDMATNPADGHGNYQASSLVVPPRANEFGFAMREDEFQILCEGEIGTARASRDLSLGLMGGAVIALAHIVATTDWKNIWQLDSRDTFLIWFTLILIIFVLSAFSTLIFHMRLKKTLTDSAYSRLKAKIENWFAAQQNVTSNQTHAVVGLTIVSARYGAGTAWMDVTGRVAARVQNGCLHISATNDELGGDPMPNTVKSMEVRYRHGGQEHSRTVQEGGFLSIPD